IRVRSGQPETAKTKKVATVGVVLHLADINPDATLTLKHGGETADMPLKDVLAGTPKKVWDGAGVVRLITTATPAVTTKAENDFPAACYGPDGTLWLAYISYRLESEDRRAAKRSMTAN